MWDTKEQTDAAYNIIVRALLHRRIEGLHSLLPRQGSEETIKPVEGKHERWLNEEVDEIFVRDINKNQKTSRFLFPNINLLLATHNKQSVLEAQKLHVQQAQQVQVANQGQENPSPLVEIAFAQLQGMADEVSCGLVADKDRRPCLGSNSSIMENQSTGSARGSLTRLPFTRNAHRHPKVYKCLAWGSVEQCLNYLVRRADENKEAAGRTTDTRRAMAGELWRRIKVRIRSGLGGN